MDDLRKKFGNAAVIRGIAYDGPEKTAAVTSRHELCSHELCAYLARHLHGLDRFMSLTSNLPIAPEITKSL